MKNRRFLSVFLCAVLALTLLTPAALANSWGLKSGMILNAVSKTHDYDEYTALAQLKLPRSEVAERVQMHVLSGMGLIVLHSGHKSKPFMRLMGTTCSLNWNEVGERERIFVIDPAHPIAKGLPAYFEVKHEEMYGEHFDVPTPDELVLSAWFQSGQIFRCGCVWRRGYGKVFYFQPGHETYPTYNENEYVRTVIRNAVRYVARPAGLNPRLDCPHVGELERVPDCDRIDH